MKWNLVKSFTIFIGVGARTLARSPEQYNQKTHSVSSNQWQWSSVADLIVTHLSLPFTLSVVLALPICKIGRRIKYANGTQSLPKSIFLYLDKLWQIILISFHENCALAAIRCCRCSFNLFSLRFALLPLNNLWDGFHCKVKHLKVSLLRTRNVASDWSSPHRSFNYFESLTTSTYINVSTLFRTQSKSYCTIQWNLLILSRNLMRKICYFDRFSLLSRRCLFAFLLLSSDLHVKKVD